VPFPSAEQSQVIAHRGSPLVVVAGPGTGKTRTLVERMIGLLREDQAREVTFITFTRTSRRDTEQKLADALGDQAAQGANLMFPRTATLHTYAKRLTHRFSHVIGREPAFSILMEGRGERALLVAEIHRDLAIQVSHVRLSTALSHARATSLWPEECEIPLDTRSHVLDRFD
jgi:superfamily I DNA/RNA helicase